jgi:hypothetical protein
MWLIVLFVDPARVPGDAAKGRRQGSLSIFGKVFGRTSYFGNFVCDNHLKFKFKSVPALAGALCYTLGLLGVLGSSGNYNNRKPGKGSNF